MKTTLYSILAAAACGMALGQTAYTNPVGYETLAINPGTNYIGVRLHEATVGSGVLLGASGTILTVADGVADALVSGKKYILEINSGTAGVLGVVTLVSSWDSVANTITTDDNLQTLLAGSGFLGNENYKLRPVSTFASVFGATNSAGLTSASSFAASDQIWIHNGATFTKYYYAAGGFGQPAAWKTSAGVVVNPSNLDLVYTDGILLVSAAGKDVTTSGEVKTGPTRNALIGATNYVGGVYPTPSSLASAFGVTNSAGLTSASSFAASDQIWIYNGSGFNKYYYAAGGFGQPAAWKTSAGVVVTPSSIDIPSGYLIVNFGVNQSILVTPPNGYDSL
jgi:hypothetical protein